MDNSFALQLIASQKIQTGQELRECNELTAPFGLSLSEVQIQSIVERRFGALKDTGRVEFGIGILKMLVTAFCDSPYLSQDNYEDTLLELQDSFYFFKNESEDRIPDDELVTFMRKHFDGICQGSIEYLNGTSLEDLCRNTRYGYKSNDTDRYGRPF